MKRLIVILSLLLAIVVPSYAEVQPPQPADFPLQMSEQVFIRSHRIDVTVENQVATTRVEQVFVNETDRMAEGTYVFPLPRGATVSDLVMWVDGQPISAKLLGSDEARGIYEEIVRQMRDPALLEYIGQDAIQASVFPIMPHDEIKIEIEYSHVLTVENGLVKYIYPLRTDQFSRRPVGTLSVSIQVESNDPISSIYSPSHNIITTRDGDTKFKAGYEATNVREPADFSLYYGLDSETINVNLLTYRESAREDGFFLLLIAPPVNPNEVEIMPKDVIVVLDQSGSMDGEKWEQAREATQYVLDNLNDGDRFNVIAFSTGWRVYANGLESVDEASRAKDWVDTLEAIGGTDIDGALGEAFKMTDSERQTTILFLTDGVPTEGETNVSQIIENAEINAPENARVFTFGVGDDVDTFLLDRLHGIFNGAGTYVRPTERIDEEVATLYNKISSPVMTDIELDFGDIVVSDTYPSTPLPDLFLGSQLIVAGRFRDEGNSTITLSGKVNGEQVNYVYDNVEFPENAGGEVTIPRLWATRAIGSLLNSIRLNGENPELVDSIVRLSLRYGIVTPYTSFLIEENDIFTQSGRDQITDQTSTNLGNLDDEFTGSEAVSAADRATNMEEAEAAPAPPMQQPQSTGSPVSGEVMPTEGQGGGFIGGNEDGLPTDADGFGYSSGQGIQVVGDRTFVFRNGVWMDTTFDADSMTPVQINFLSEAYFNLLDQFPSVGMYLSLGDHIIFVLDGQAYEILP